jgi:drug/metabolite transporter (DMT)-like permease
MKYYRYLYYKFFCLWHKKKSEQDIAPMNAASAISLTFAMLFVSIVLILLLFFKERVDFLVFFNDKNRIIWLILGLLFYFSNWFFLARGKHHQKILEEFKDETDVQRKRGMIVAIVFLIVSLGAPLVILGSFYLMNKPLC